MSWLPGWRISSKSGTVSQLSGIVATLLKIISFSYW